MENFMKDLVEIKKAKQLLKNVKGSQFFDREEFNQKQFYHVYSNFSKITRSTDKALFISTPSHPGCKDGYWVPKSQVSFRVSDKNDTHVEIHMRYSKNYTNVEKEARAMGGDSNSVWCSIFSKQDGNGLTINGYALD